MIEDTFETDLLLLKDCIAKKKDEVGQVLENKCLVIVLHFLRDLIPFLNGLKKLGAKPQNCFILAKPYPYPYKERIKNWLQDNEFNVSIAKEYPITSQCEEILHKAYRHSISSNLKIIIAEDGGHIGQHVLDLPGQDMIMGAIEQTTKGYWKYKELEKKGKLSFPVLSVASSKFKSDYEPRFIGKTIVKNIRKFLPEVHLSGKKALVFGYGSVGSMVSHYLRSIEGMIVDVCEIDAKKRLLARFDNFNAKSNIKEFVEKNWYIVVGCTGGKKENGEKMPTIDEDVISLLPHGCILVSASSDQIEIDVECLKRYSQGHVENIYLKEIIEEAQEETDGEDVSVQALLRKIKVGSKYKLTLLRRTQTSPEIILLADGYPINFYSSDSVPNESIDPIMTTIFLSTVHLARHHEDLKNAVLDKEVDEIINEERMIETFSKFHGLD